MLIEDGERLYMVSEDPKIKELMRELDKGTASKMPLESLESIKSGSAEKIEKLTAEIKTSYNFRDMSRIMKYYEDVTYELNSIEKTAKIRALKEVIKHFISDVDKYPGWSARNKLLYMYKQIPGFVRESYVSLLSSKGYAKFKDYILNDGYDFESDYRQTRDHLLERTK